MQKIKYILLFFNMLCITVNAQNKESIITKKDKICSTAPSKTACLVPEEFQNLSSHQIDSSGYFYQDNIFSQKSTAFYDSLRQNSAKYGKLSKQITDLLIQPKQAEQRHSQSPSTKVHFYAYSDKIVRHIEINTQNVFSSTGTNISQNRTMLQNIGNKMHIETHENVIQQNIFIRPGMPLKPEELADNERYLRQLPFIQDAKILPVIVPSSADSVDLLVITTDLWSMDMKNSFKTTNEGYAFLENKNTLGSGVHTGLRLDYAQKHNFQHDHAFFIRSENLFGSFIRGQLNWLEFNNERYYGIQFDKRFFTRGAQTAGGIHIYKSMERHPEYRQNISTSMNVGDAWFGRAFPHYHIFNIPKLYPVMSVRYINRQAAKSPQISHELGKYWEFRDMQLFLANISMNKRDYFTSYLVSKFGITEDIPLGFNQSTTHGFETNHYGTRGYAGSAINWASLLASNRYIHAGCAFGTFYKNNQFQEGTLDVSFNSFSKLYPFSSAQIRHFTGLRYIHGFRQPPGEMINFVYPKALRGFYDPWIAGTKRLVLNYEMVTFLPYDFYGFRFAGFTFADIGVINSERTALLKNTYAAVGLGFRIRNDHFVIKTMQFAITLIGDLQTGDTRLSFGYNGKETINYYDFENTMPDIVRFE